MDTADVDEIRQALEMGMVDGVTTNPSLVAKTGRKYDDVIKEISSMVDGPVSAEVISTDTEGMMREARHYAEIANNIVVKLPMTNDGLKATRMCCKEGIVTNVTLVFQPIQGLLAAKAGASFISPFVGRLDDICRNGMDMVEELKTMLINYGYSTEIIVASIRNPLHVVESAMVGAHVITIPLSVLRRLVKHPLTDIGLRKFLEDYKKVPK
jgi:transaldolase